MKKRLGFVCNSSSSDYIIDDFCSNCDRTDYEEVREKEKKEVLEEVKENIFNYFPKKKKFDSQANTMNESRKNSKIYNKAVNDCKKAVLQVLGEL